ncbi:MAG: sialidase family protein, partial [Candidatus Methanoperedens sp.]
ADTIGTIYTTTVSTSATFNDGTATVVSVMSDSNGNLYAILSDSGTHMWLTISTDGGATWSVPEEINSGTEAVMSAAILPTANSPAGIGFVYGTSSAAKYDYLPFGWTGVTSTIPGNWPTFGGAQVGPWYSQGNIYILSTNVSTGAITMYYSGDGGLTWTAVTASQPSSCTTAGFIGGTGYYLASNTSVYVAYFVDNKTINVMPFACTSAGGTWGTAKGNRTLGASASTSPQLLQIAAVSDTNIVVYFNYYYSASYTSTAGYAKWTGSWGTTTVLSTTSNNPATGMCVDSASRYTFIYNYPPGTYCRTLNNAGTLTAQVTIGSASLAAANSAATGVISFTMGGTNYIGVGVVNSASPYNLMFYYWVAADSPTGIASSTISTVQSAVVPPRYSDTNVCSFAFDGTNLYCYWFGSASEEGFSAVTTDRVNWTTLKDWGQTGVVGKGISAEEI